MATEAQIAANRRNAQSSTGPKTVEGKARVSRNAAIFGIYSAGDAVRPDEEPIYHLFCEGFEQDLAPEGAMETTLAAEIIHAAWRLRRCAEAESTIEFRIEGKADAQNSIDRARTQALRHFQRATAELRRIQTERQIRSETVPEDFDASTLGLASCKDMAPILKSDLRRQLLLHKLKETEMSTAVAEAICAPMPSAIQTLHAMDESAPIPRGAPCPCGSGAKYKRCCGTNAPAVLAPAA
jgi:SEC-C motif